MVTKRTPRNRPSRPEITPQVLTAWAEGKRLQRCWLVDENRYHDEYHAAWGELHALLGLRPWDHNPLDAHAGSPLYPKGTVSQSWGPARELRRRLDAALRAAKVP